MFHLSVTKPVDASEIQYNQRVFGGHTFRGIFSQLRQYTQVLGTRVAQLWLYTARTYHETLLHNVV